jgi:hypothetical protein
MKPKTKKRLGLALIVYGIGGLLTLLYWYSIMMRTVPPGQPVPYPDVRVLVDPLLLALALVFLSPAVFLGMIMGYWFIYAFPFLMLTAGYAILKTRFFEKHL